MNGNTTGYGPDGYSYDEENRLTKATFGPLSILGQYQYDTFGRRVSKIDSLGAQTFYYYDGWRTIEDQSSAGVTQATYVFGNYVDEGLTMDRGGHTYYYHQNALWSVYALSNSSGVGIEGYYYDAYGLQTVVLPGEDGILDFDSDDVYVPGARSSVGNPFLFTGQRFDPETGLLYYRDRHYSTSFARFLSRDSIDYPGGLKYSDPVRVPLTYNTGANLYEYASSNPANELDPFGEQGETPGQASARRLVERTKVDINYWERMQPSRERTDKPQRLTNDLIMYEEQLDKLTTPPPIPRDSAAAQAQRTIEEYRNNLNDQQRTKTAKEQGFLKGINSVLQTCAKDSKPVDRGYIVAGGVFDPGPPPVTFVGVQVISRFDPGSRVRIQLGDSGRTVQLDTAGTATTIFVIEGRAEKLTATAYGFYKGERQTGSYAPVPIQEKK